MCRTTTAARAEKSGPPGIVTVSPGNGPTGAGGEGVECAIRGWMLRGLRVLCGSIVCVWRSFLRRLFSHPDTSRLFFFWFAAEFERDSACARLEGNP